MQLSRGHILSLIAALGLGFAAGAIWTLFRIGASDPRLLDRGRATHHMPAEDASSARREIEPPPMPTSRGVTGDDAATAEWKERAWQVEVKRRSEAVLQPTDTGLDALRRIFDHGGDPDQVFRDFDSFKRPLEVLGEPEVVVHLDPATANETLRSLRMNDVSRTLFLFSAGEFDLSEQIELTRTKNVVIRGQGVDHTIIRPKLHDLVSLGHVENLTIEDLTFECSSIFARGIFNCRRGSSSVLLRHLRVVGFDGPSRYSSPLGVSSEMYVAIEDCEFRGGSGRFPLSGAAISLRDRALVYFKNCRMPELGDFLSAPEKVASGAIVMVESCEIPWNRSMGDWLEGVDLRIRSSRILGLGKTPERGQNFRDLGGNVIRPADPQELPDLMTAVTSLERLGLEITYARIEASLNVGNTDAAYVVVATEENGRMALSRWFCAPEVPSRRPLRFAGSEDEAGLLRAGITTISASRALALAQPAATTTRSRIAEKVKLGALEGGRLVWSVRFGSFDVIKVDATTGDIVE